MCIQRNHVIWRKKMVYRCIHDSTFGDLDFNLSFCMMKVKSNRAVLCDKRKRTSPCEFLRPVNWTNFRTSKIKRKKVAKAIKTRTRACQASREAPDWATSPEEKLEIRPEKTWICSSASPADEPFARISVWSHICWKIWAIASFSALSNDADSCQNGFIL